MLERKQYLICLHCDGAYELEICSDINDLLLKCASALIDDPKSSLLIHAGFLLPDPEDYLHILKKFVGDMAISKPASSNFFEIPTSGEIGCYKESMSGQDISLLLVDREFSHTLWDPTMILNFSPEWILDKKISDLTDLPFTTRNKFSSYGIIYVKNLLKFPDGDALLYLEKLEKKDLVAISESIINSIKKGKPLVEADANSDPQFNQPSNGNGSSSMPFEKWIISADVNDPIAILRRSPEWLLDLEISSLIGITTRLVHRCGYNGVIKNSDFLSYTTNSILKWEGIGGKSVKELSESIIATVTAGQAKDLKGDENTPQIISATLRESFNGALDSLTERETKILKMRLGYDLNKPMTLEEIGSEFSVTRERIRQVEATAKRKLKAFPIWRDGVIEKKVKVLMSNRTEPCYLDLISIEDDWFEGFSRNTKCLGELIEGACNKKLKAISIGGRDVISKIGGKDWGHAKQEVISILDTHLASQLTKEDVLLLIESHLGKYDAQELTSILFDKISSQLHFFPTEVGGDELASIGRGSNSLVLAILKASNIPLHYSEVHNRCLKMGYEIDVRRVHNALSSDVAWLFSLGTYGLRKHLQLSKPEEAELLSQLEDIILSGDPDRQWNCAVLTEQLCKQFPGTPEIVDKYVVNIILEKSIFLTFLGRFVWVRSEQAKKQNISRIDIQEASTALIEKKGRPMSARELKHQIMKQRGMSEYFCLKVTNSITRVSPSVWGLVNRDFYLNRQQIEQLLDFFYVNFLSKNKGLYIDEARWILENNRQHIPEKLTDYMIFSLAQTDPRFAVRRGQLLGLSEWPNAKRLTIREASCKAASELSEFSYSADLRSRIEELIGRKISVNNQFNEGIQDAGFVYNELEHKWIRD